MGKTPCPISDQTTSTYPPSSTSPSKPPPSCPPILKSHNPSTTTATPTTNYNPHNYYYDSNNDKNKTEQKSSRSSKVVDEEEERRRRRRRKGSGKGQDEVSSSPPLPPPNPFNHRPILPPPPPPPQSLISDFSQLFSLSDPNPPNLSAATEEESGTASVVLVDTKTDKRFPEQQTQRVVTAHRRYTTTTTKSNPNSARHTPSSGTPSKASATAAQQSFRAKKREARQAEEVRRLVFELEELIHERRRDHPRLRKQSSLQHRRDRDLQKITRPERDSEVVNAQASSQLGATSCVGSHSVPTPSTHIPSSANTNINYSNSRNPLPPSTNSSRAPPCSSLLSLATPYTTTIRVNNKKWTYPTSWSDLGKSCSDLCIRQTSSCLQFSSSADDSRSDSIASSSYQLSSSAPKRPVPERAGTTQTTITAGENRENSFSATPFIHSATTRIPPGSSNLGTILSNPTTTTTTTDLTGGPTPIRYSTTRNLSGQPASHSPFTGSKNTYHQQQQQQQPEESSDRRRSSYYNYRKSSSEHRDSDRHRRFPSAAAAPSSNTTTNPTNNSPPKAIRSRSADRYTDLHRRLPTITATTNPPFSSSNGHPVHSTKVINNCRPGNNTEGGHHLVHSSTTERNHHPDLLLITKKGGEEAEEEEEDDNSSKPPAVIHCTDGSSSTEAAGDSISSFTNPHRNNRIHHRNCCHWTSSTLSSKKRRGSRKRLPAEGVKKQEKKEVEDDDDDEEDDDEDEDDEEGEGMGQRLARQDVDEGVRLYHLQKHEEAVLRWKAALRRLRSPEDRFITMGYLTQAFCESGAYKDMLVYALQQIDLGNDQEDAYMRAEAYLNLARANERLCEFHKAISYGRHSLQNQSMDPRTPGYAYLCIGCAYLGFSNFQLSLDHFEQAMRVANSTQDRLLELQICVGLGSLFTQLKDLSKAVVFLKNALGLLKTVSIVDVQAKYRSLILYHLSIALRRKGAITDAKQAAEEALRLAAENGNRPIQGRCLHSLGDIHREFRDVDKTWSRYEAALSLLEEMEDKMGEVWVLGSMAKTAVSLQRPGQQHCECQAIQLNKRCLELSKSIGSKLGMLKCHGRLCSIYSGLSDEESEEVARKAATSLTQEMELFCNFCGQRYAIQDNSLQALPCSHIFHEKCLQTYLTGRERKECPKCGHRAATLASLPSTSANPIPIPPPHPRVVLLAETGVGPSGEVTGPSGRPGMMVGGPMEDSGSGEGGPSTSSAGILLQHHRPSSHHPHHQHQQHHPQQSQHLPHIGFDSARIGTRSPSLDEQRPISLMMVASAAAAEGGGLHSKGIIDIPPGGDGGGDGDGDEGGGGGGLHLLEEEIPSLPETSSAQVLANFKGLATIDAIGLRGMGIGGERNVHLQQQHQQSASIDIPPTHQHQHQQQYPTSILKHQDTGFGSSPSSSVSTIQHNPTSTPTPSSFHHQHQHQHQHSTHTLSHAPHTSTISNPNTSFESQSQQSNKPTSNTLPRTGPHFSSPSAAGQQQMSESTASVGAATTTPTKKYTVTEV